MCKINDMVVKWLIKLHNYKIYLRHVVVGKHIFVHHFVITAQNTTYVPYHIVCVSLLNDLSNTYQISCIVRHPQALYHSTSSGRTSSAHLFSSTPAILLAAKNSRRHRSIQASERNRSEPNDISCFH